MFTCFIRYQIAPGKRAEFLEYAHAWIALIRKYGGTHHGYFLPGGEGDVLPEAAFSFPELGHAGPPDTGVALFSFPSLEAYEKYRRDVAQDEGCDAATARFNETRCFTRYERSFLVPVFD
ncbi:MAG: NIPSNAP family protein [Rhizomicrobium sp.]